MIRFGALVVSLVLLIVSIPAWIARGQTNLDAIGIIQHVQISHPCTVLGAEMTWDSSDMIQIQDPYLRTVAAAAGAPGSADSATAQAATIRADRAAAEELLQAQSLIKQGQYAKSLMYLREANAAGALLEAGHTVGARGDMGCRLFNWLLAEDISPAPLPDGVTREGLASWASSLIATGQAGVVVDGYQQALRYQPARVDWQLMLARALLAQKRPAEAEAVLRSVITAAPQQCPDAVTLLKTFYDQNNQPMPSGWACGGAQAP